MRKLLFAFLLLSACPAFANDTLTWGRTYDYSIGDTFDYRYYSHNITYPPNINPEDITSIAYGRFAVTNIYYSLDSTIRYIEQKRLYPEPVIFDTLTVTDLSTYDLAWYGCLPNMPIITNSQYHNRVVNIMIPDCVGENHVEFVFADGLGTVLDYRWGGDDTYDAYLYWDSTELIYYAKGSETWGTPYSDFATGLQPLSVQDGHITLFPTLNDGTFNLKISDASLLPVNLTVYDVLGRDVKQLTLNNLNNSISFEPWVSGMFVWKAISNGQLIETGKIVVH